MTHPQKKSTPRSQSWAVVWAVLITLVAPSCDDPDEDSAPPAEEPIACDNAPEIEILAVMDAGSWSNAETSASECPQERAWCQTGRMRWINMAAAAGLVAREYQGAIEVGVLNYPGSSYAGSSSCDDCGAEPTLASSCDVGWPQADIGTDWSVNEIAFDAFRVNRTGTGSTALALERARQYFNRRPTANRVRIAALFTNAAEKCGGDLRRTVSRLRQDGIYVLVIALNSATDDQLEELARQGGMARNVDGLPAYLRVHEDLMTQMGAVLDQLPNEICDGIDNDCDGTVDEGIARDCADQCGGVQQCVSGEWMACGPTVSERPEAFYRGEMSDPNSYPAEEGTSSSGSSSGLFGAQEAPLLWEDDAPAPGTEYCEDFDLDGQQVPVDIVWAIDQSGSMRGEIQAVRDNINEFASFLVEQNLDYHMMMVGMRYNDPRHNEICVPEPLAGPNCADSDRFRQFERHVNSHDALSIIESFFDDIHDFTRFGSSKQVIVITDDTSDRDPTTFRNFVESYEDWDDWTFHGIIGKPNGNCNPGIGERYESLATWTGGSTFDICQDDWSALFDRLATTVTSIVRNHVPSYTPQPGSIVVSAEGDTLAEDTDWYWNSNNNAIVLLTSLPPSVTTIRACYLVASDERPGDKERPDELRSEYCDALDNDCDGEIDEDYDVGDECSAGIGACRRVGRFVCADEYSSACNVVEGTPTQEVCDGIDNDCDGQIDENLVVTCSDGCQVRTCSDGHFSSCQPPMDHEICDGEDNDCDGAVDEDFHVGESCEVTAGSCQAWGEIQCDGEYSTQCVYQGLLAGPEPEVCDGADNDCDGQTDEATDGLCPEPGQACYNGECVYD